MRTSGFKEESMPNLQDAKDAVDDYIKTNAKRYRKQYGTDGERSLHPEEILAEAALVVGLCIAERLESIGDTLSRIRTFG